MLFYRINSNQIKSNYDLKRSGDVVFQYNDVTPLNVILGIVPVLP